MTVCFGSQLDILIAQVVEELGLFLNDLCLILVGFVTRSEGIVAGT